MTKTERDMSNFAICLVVIHILLYIWFRVKWRKPEEDKNKTDYFNRLKKGENALRIMTSTNVSDSAFIESLLRYHNIPYMINYYHICTLRPGPFIKDFNNLYIYVLEKDHDDAGRIIKYYFENKRSDITMLSKMRNIFELFVINWIFPNNRFSGNSKLYLTESMNKGKEIYCLKCQTPFLISKRHEKTNLCVKCFNKDL